MSVPEQKVVLQRFIQVSELLDQAFADIDPTPDYLAHECELAEQALSEARAPVASTADPVLANLFSLRVMRPDFSRCGKELARSQALIERSGNQILRYLAERGFHHEHPRCALLF